jgi:hypothetical protein
MLHTIPSSFRTLHRLIRHRGTRHLEHAGIYVARRCQAGVKFAPAVLVEIFLLGQFSEAGALASLCGNAPCTIKIAYLPYLSDLVVSVHGAHNNFR